MQDSHLGYFGQGSAFACRKADRYAPMPDRPFDPHWTTVLPSLTEYLDDLCHKLTVAEERHRRRRADAQSKFEDAIKAISLDLFRAHQSNPNLEVGIGVGRETLQRRSDSQYGSSVFTPRSFEAAMKGLLKAEYIEESATYWHDPSGKNSRVARYQASSALSEQLKKVGASLVTLRRHSNAEGIILKDEKKKLVEYGDIQFANDARDKLRTINGMLESHWADLALTDEAVAKELIHKLDEQGDEYSQPFDLASRTLYRVFNDNDWKHGGRFYGAWWISVPSKLRRHILIDGKQTVEVDYSGLHAAMLFAIQGLPIPDDPYERCLTKAANKTERKLVKRTFNALLNADSVNKLSKIEGYSPELTGKDWYDFKKFIVNCYPEFESYFGSGVGLRLQRKDSDLAEAVMLKFATLGYACLPIHDSFIVHHALQDDLTEAMQSAFEDKFGAVGKVGYELGLDEQVFPTGEPIEMDINPLLHLSNYEARLQEFWDNKAVLSER